MSHPQRLIPYEAYPLVLFITGIVSFAAYRCYSLAKNPYVQFKRSKDENIAEKTSHLAKENSPSEEK